MGARRGSTSGLGPAEAGAAAPELRDVAVEVDAAAAEDLAKVLARVWRGGGTGGSEGAFEQALERTRDSDAELRNAAAAEMRHAAARHRDMVSFRSGRRGRGLGGGAGGDGYGLWLTAQGEAWARGAGSHRQMRRGALDSLARGPSPFLVRSLSLRLGAVHLDPCAEPQAAGTERTGWWMPPSQSLPEPKTQAQTRRSAYPLPQDTTSCRARGRSQRRRSAPFGGGDGADALLPLRALLLQP
jgi:hypothetical protein